MDVSLIAAVGSFVVSERVLKPKATALFILGCVLAYDLKTKTHDPVSLRVYRGPALLAFTLMMCALSLRIWRRNGVACDELLFLPGTQHGQNNGIDAPLVESPMPPAMSPSPSPSLQSSSFSPQSQTVPLDRLGQPPLPLSPPLAPSEQLALEADVAAGGRIALTHQPPFRSRRTYSDDVELSNITSNPARCSETSSSSLNAVDHLQRHYALTTDNQQQFPQTANANRTNEIHRTSSADAGSISPQRHVASLINRTASADGGDDDIDHDTVDTDALLDNINNSNSNNGNNASNDNQQNPMQRFRDNHPQITRIGTFFFFRSSSTTTQNAAYAPSGPSVFGAALDMSMPILFNFHIFIEAYNHLETQETTAKILPLIFLSVLIVRTGFPPSRRGRFWSTMKFTFTAPLHHVQCRDEYIGEVLTSLVRPFQDIFFALAYYVTVVYGMTLGGYGLDRSGEYLEESWVLHNIILPTCAILPLWWKYLQTLRQAYDANKRWPHQANSLKYLFSTLVIIYGMTHSEDRRSPWWLVCFGLTVVYQVWWDVVMDWDLFHIQREVVLIDSEHDSWFENISSIRPNSTVLLFVQMHILQPVFGAIQRIRAHIPHWRQIQLREKRLYKTEAFYWKIFFFNLFLRFTWMLCFIPPYHFSKSQKYVTASTDTNSYFGVLLPVAELLRRACWGFLYMEKETIRMMDSDAIYSRVDTAESNDIDSLDGAGDEDDNSKTLTKSFRVLPTWMDVQQQVAHDAATSNAKQRETCMRNLFVAELFGWALAFIGLGCWSAY